MTEHRKKITFDRTAIFVALGIFVVIGGGAMAAAYFGATKNQVYIDQSKIEAPAVDLSPTQSGVLRDIYVTPGQMVTPGTTVAQVGVELLKASQGGLVLATNGDVGDTVAAHQTVVEMIDPQSLRVVGQIDENKGLNRIKVGDPVAFTVDAFGGKQFTGVVDEISPTSNQSGVVFNISSQRQEQQFDVKARFNVADYPELKNGMSARMWVYLTQ